MGSYKLFTKQMLLMILTGIGINILGVKLALAYQWPLFLDSIGTILVAALGGYLPGIFVGFFSNVFNGITDPITLYYGIISVLFAVLAHLLSVRGVFKNIWHSLGSIVLFTIIGGGLGSVLTWMLYGFNFGSGISAGLAIFLDNSTGLGKFASQLTADFSIDLLDKFVTILIVYVVLNHLPKAILRQLPHGYLYDTDKSAEEQWFKLLRLQDRRHGFSLQKKVMLLIFSTSAVLSIMAVTISFQIYKNTANQMYVDRCENVVSLMIAEINADRVNYYLETNDSQARDYRRTQRELHKIKDSFTKIKFIYVYQIRADGCHVVFDFDTPDVPAGKLGEVIEIEDSFKKYLPQLLAGEEIESVISNDSFGWLLTTYKPVRDSEGKCVAYAAADIDMQDVVTDQYIFLIKMISLFFGVSIFIVALAIWLADHSVVRPINALARVADEFAYDSAADRQKSTEMVRRLGIKTNDEIENLYEAMSKMVADVSSYIGEINDKACIIAKMQDNIILSFANMVENRDESTGGHIKRTAAYVALIARDMLEHGDYPEVLDAVYVENMIKSAPLHDIGKIKITDNILNKPGKLTDEEFNAMKEHTVFGHEILANAMGGIEGENYLRDAMDMALYHHERWDGKGYPTGCDGKDIPVSARIMAVADVFDALVSKRSYKAPFGFDKAVGIIKEEAGTHFDPLVVEAFLRVSERLKVEMD